MRKMLISLMILQSLVIQCSVYESDCLSSDASCNESVAYLSSLLVGNTEASVIQAYTSGMGFYQSSGDGVWEYNSYAGPSSALTQVVVSNSTLIGIDGTTADTVYLSTDKGLSWQSATLSIGAAPVHIASCNGTTVVITGAAPIASYRSTDDGASWTGPVTVQGGGGFNSGDLFCSGDNFYAMTDAGSNQDGAYSGNGGTSWSTFTGTGTPSTLFAFQGTSDGATKAYIEAASGLTVHNGSASNNTFVNTFNVYSGTSPTDAAIINIGNQFWMAGRMNSACRFFSTTGFTTYPEINLPCTISMNIRDGGHLDSHIFFGGGESGTTPRIFASYDAGSSFSEDTLPSQSTEVVHFITF